MRLQARLAGLELRCLLILEAAQPPRAFFQFAPHRGGLAASKARQRDLLNDLLHPRRISAKQPLVFHPSSREPEVEAGLQRRAGVLDARVEALSPVSPEGGRVNDWARQGHRWMLRGALEDVDPIVGPRKAEVKSNRPVGSEEAVCLNPDMADQ